MNRSIRLFSLAGAALVLSVLAANNVAMAMPIISTTWFSDNFDSYTSGIRLRLQDSWTGTGPENIVLVPTGGTTLAVRMKGSSGAGTASLTNHTVPGVAGQLSIMTFQVKPEDSNAFTNDHAGIWMFDTLGAVIAGWTGGEFRMKTKWTYPAGTEGTSVNFPPPDNTTWHDFAIVYDPATGTTDFYKDTVLITTHAGPLNKTLGSVQVDDTPPGAGTANNILWLDNLVVGTVPEPASLILLGLGGLLLRRRRVA